MPLPLQRGKIEEEEDGLDRLTSEIETLNVSVQSRDSIRTSRERGTNFCLSRLGNLSPLNRSHDPLLPSQRQEEREMDASTLIVRVFVEKCSRLRGCANASNRTSFGGQARAIFNMR